MLSVRKEFTGKSLQWSISTIKVPRGEFAAEVERERGAAFILHLDLRQDGLGRSQGLCGGFRRNISWQNHPKLTAFPRTIAMSFNRAAVLMDNAMRD